MTSNNKVLIICPFTSPNQGGVESHIQKLTQFLKKKNKKAIIISYQPLTTPVKAKGYEKKENYEIYRMPWFANGLFPKIEHNSILTFLYLVPGILFLSLMVGIKRRKEIGVIHSHGFAAGFVGTILGGILRKRKVISTHAIYNFENRPFLAFLIRNILFHYDYVLAVGEPSRQELIKIGIPKEKIAIHPNWIDTDFFKPNIKIKSKTIQIIFVGRGLKKKGIFLFGEIAKSNPSLNFVSIVGDGPDRKTFIDRYKNLKNLMIITRLPSDYKKKMMAIRDNYQSSDIFIMPSLYAEGFASVILESAGSGLAIISSNKGTLLSILKNSGAVLIDPTLKNFNNEIKKLVNNKKVLHEKQHKMRQFALKKFSDMNAKIIYNRYTAHD